ncbi:RNA polymerase subunit sigma-24 [Pseudomonas kairouanensis]|uniref:RNA polymerase subunit sigma-24 n=1 Tax=Pseudomonas kairouanensis TaxID=2293832 RepID=A0A4Z0ADL9_9PSED|nr:RNA polymerase subunit sigma-24 [Pseudomonas kairouanensis]TFY84393.1 RNA polymerase subunit sigma-24 [Pseudomonas kairouanensis]
MTEGYRASCLSTDDRLASEALRLLMAHVVSGNRSAGRRLSIQVTPLLKAFYEGQVQAGRIRPEQVECLVHSAFKALLEKPTDYDPCQPFRAWLLDIARTTLLHHLRANTVVPLLNPPDILWAI